MLKSFCFLSKLPWTFDKIPWFLLKSFMSFFLQTHEKKMCTVEHRTLWFVTQTLCWLLQDCYLLLLIVILDWASYPWVYGEKPLSFWQKVETWSYFGFEFFFQKCKKTSLGFELHNLMSKRTWRPEVRILRISKEFSTFINLRKFQKRVL